MTGTRMFLEYCQESSLSREQLLEQDMCINLGHSKKELQWVKSVIK